MVTLGLMELDLISTAGLIGYMIIVTNYKVFIQYMPVYWAGLVSDPAFYYPPV